MRFAADGPALVVSPHLDDAVLSAWSVLTHPADVEVVNVFTGVPRPGFVSPFDRTCGAVESSTHFEDRIREDREALSLAGRIPRGLGFLEGQYRDEPADRAAIARELGNAGAGCSQLVLPAGIRGNEDHLAVRDAGLEAAGAEIPILLYAELPYAIHKGWPHWVTGDEPDPHLDPDVAFEAWLATVPRPREALRRRVVTFTEAEAAKKLGALRAYRTQFAQLNSGPIRRLENPVVNRYEVFWSVDS